MFKSVFSFEGRINRREYLLSFLIFAAGVTIMDSIVISILAGYMDTETYAPVAHLISLIACAPFAFFYFAQGAKRCHDISTSMWWQLVPFFGLLLVLKKGDLTRNEYGANPKRAGSNRNRDTRHNGDDHYLSSRQLENPYVETRNLLRKSKLDGLISEDEYREKNNLLDINEREYNEKKDLLIRKEEVDKIAKPILDNLDKLVIDGIFTQAEYEEKKQELYDRLLSESHQSRRIKIANSYTKRIFHPFKR